MTIKGETINDLDRDEKLRLVVDILKRTIVHYGMWYAEVHHQLGEARAHEALQTATDRGLAIQLKRLGKVFGFPTTDEGLPQALFQLPDETLDAALDAVAANWLVNDGVWFQALEFVHGMNDAKRCNDSCWGRFSPYEARTIKDLLGLPEHPGLEGLRRALTFRVYARINTFSFVEEADGALVFRMNECRVQTVRKKKGLDDYPCKSVGLVEYPYFARTIDPRIKTECVGCPPDAHPEEWFCAWRFRLAE